jgi:hypothetical protein
MQRASPSSRQSQEATGATEQFPHRKGRVRSSRFGFHAPSIGRVPNNSKAISNTTPAISIGVSGESSLPVDKGTNQREDVATHSSSSSSSSDEDDGSGALPPPPYRSGSKRRISSTVQDILHDNDDDDDDLLFSSIGRPKKK